MVNVGYLNCILIKSINYIRFLHIQNSIFELMIARWCLLEQRLYTEEQGAVVIGKYFDKLLRIS